MTLDAAIQQKILDAYQGGREAAVAQGKKANEGTNKFGFPWSQTAFGSDGRRLYVHERDDRPGEVRVRWQATDEEAARRRSAKRPKPVVAIPQTIRDDRGRLRKRALDLAVEAAKTTYENWLTPPAEGDAAGQHQTLEDVLRYFVDPATGARQGGRWKKESVGTFPINHSRRTHLAIISETLDLDMDPRRIRQEHAQRLWRAVSQEHKHSGIGGRKAEQVVATLVAALNHSRTNQRLGGAEGVIPDKWREAWRADWISLTGTDPAEADRPPYTPDEARALFEHLHQADPRLRVALEIGVGYRVVQVATYALRSGLSDEGVYGTRISFVDRKSNKTVRIDLAPRQQATLRHAMTNGYLSEFEALYQAGKLSDYYLVPGGRTRRGKARPEHAGEPLDRTALRTRLRSLEAMAGVRHVDKRGFHGLRRTFEELIGEETTDARVRDVAQGWSVGGGTRELIYTARESERLLAKGARARAAALEGISAPQTPVAVADGLLAEAQQLQDRVRAATEALAGLDLNVAARAADALIDELRVIVAAAAELSQRPVAPPPSLAERHAALEEEFSCEMKRRGLTGKDTARLLGTSSSDISAIRRAKSLGIIKLERLQRLLDELRASPEKEP